MAQVAGTALMPESFGPCEVKVLHNKHKYLNVSAWRLVHRREMVSHDSCPPEKILLTATAEPITDDLYLSCMN